MQKETERPCRGRRETSGSVATSTRHSSDCAVTVHTPRRETTRENKVKNFIEKFENHKHKESFLQDLSQTQKINTFSKESQDLIADMNKHRDLRTLRKFLQNNNVLNAIPSGISG